MSSSKDYESDPWLMQKWESASAFAAFEIYRDMPPATRSLAALGEALKKVKQHCGRWSTANKWQERVAAWDRHNAILRARAREREHKTALDQFANQQQQLHEAALRASVKTFQIANAMLNKLVDHNGMLREDLDPKSIPTFLRTAAYVGEVAGNAQAQSLAVRELLSQFELDEDLEDTGEDDE